MLKGDRLRTREHTAAIRALAELAGIPAGRADRGAPPGEPARDAALSAFVRATLAQYGDLLGFLDFQAQIAPPSANGSVAAWITCHDWLDDEDRARAVARARGAENGEPFQIGADLVWVIVRPIGGQPGRGLAGALGVLLAIFETEESADAAAADVEAVADDLALGVRARRRALGDATLAGLSSILADAGSHEDALRRLVHWLCEATRSDGARIHVLRRTLSGPRIELLYRTDEPSAERTRYGLSKSRGLADWVFAHDDWLLVADPRGPRERGKEPELAISGKHGEVRVHRRLGKEHDPEDARANRERGLLLVPITIQGKPLGVLTLWRSTDDAYDPAGDLAPVESMAGHLASACRWLIHWEANQRAVDEVAEIGRVVTAGETSQSVYQAVAAGAGRLANAARSVLLLSDPDRAGCFYEVATWSATDTEAEPDTHARRLCVDASDAPAEWELRVKGALLTMGAALGEPRSAPKPPSRMVSAASPDPGQQALSVRAVLPLASLPSGGAVVLLDREKSAGGPKVTCDDGVAEEVVTTFLRQVGAIAVESYPRVFAQKVARELSDPLAPPIRRGTETPEEVLRRAAALLLRRTRCDAVLVYREDRGRMVVTSASPHRADLQGIVAGFHTNESARAGDPFRVLDVSDPNGPSYTLLEHTSLRRIADAYGWKGVRSWICFPLIENGRCLGLLKLLTQGGGAFLDPGVLEVIKAVAARAAAEMHRLTRGMMVEALNDLALHLGGKERHQLTEAMGLGIERWVRRFIHPGCHAAVIATVTGPHPRLFAACPHLDAERFDADNERQLSVLADAPKSQRGEVVEAVEPWAVVLRGKLSSSEEAAPGKASAPRPPAHHGDHQMVIPIGAPGNRSLAAWLLVIGEQPFSGEDLAAGREAAREMSIFLDYEHRRHIWAHQVARFRHAVIGPVQGLVSAARMLHMLAHQREPDPEELRKLGLRIEEEAETTRLWRENQRIYMAEEVEVVLKHQPLRPVVQRSFERFVSVLLARGIQLKLEWRPHGSVDFPFDAAALDLILTNLLDNARKYAFFNREIELGVEIDGPMVKLWVENVGHAIPERLSRSIYRVGERLDWKDPIRAIDGTGLGLPMARALVEAHGGRIYHTSQPQGSPKGAGGAGPGHELRAATRDGPTEIQPHWVKFVVELPHQWRPR